MLSFTSLLTLTVTNPPGDKQGFLVQEIFTVLFEFRELKSWETKPTAEFAALMAFTSLLETTYALAALRAETSAARYALATKILELAIMDNGTSKATVIPMNSTTTFPTSDPNRFIAMPRQLLALVQSSEFRFLNMEF